MTSIAILISPDSISAAATSRISASFDAAATSFLCCRDNSSDSSLAFSSSTSASLWTNVVHALTASALARALVAAILAVDNLELLEEADINDLVSS